MVAYRVCHLHCSTPHDCPPPPVYRIIGVLFRGLSSRCAHPVYALEFLTFANHQPSSGAAMPRFLNTITGEFESHDDPSKVVYAIFSHTWNSCAEGSEQKFDTILKLQSERPNNRPASDPPTEPPLGPLFDHPRLSTKIRKACEVARLAGYRLLWYDAPCINRRNSAEVSVTLNLMFELYRLADVCYVYLRDVPSGDDPTAGSSKFRNSRWHKRGWTLQELIAPERVIFLSETWELLGTKTGLAPTLEKITDVDFSVLTGQRELKTISVAKRMSWAASRQTKFVEDQAYSLLGIFGVFIAPIYGEGANAFLRLQEEIVKTIPDQSIFAWGRSYTLESLDTRSRISSSGSSRTPGLLAGSTSSFLEAGAITKLSPGMFADRFDASRNICVPPLNCIFTPQGAIMELLCFDLPANIHMTFPKDQDGERECSHGARVLALLQCKDAHGSLIALPLLHSGSNPRLHESFNVSTHPEDTFGAPQPFHFVRVTKAALSEVKTPITIRRVSLLRHYPGPLTPKSLLPGFTREPQLSVLHLRQKHGNEGPEFAIPRWVAKQMEAVGCKIAPLVVIPDANRTKVILKTTIAENLPLPSLPTRTRSSMIIDLQLTLTSTAVGSQPLEGIPKHVEFTFDVRHGIEVTGRQTQWDMPLTFKGALDADTATQRVLAEFTDVFQTPTLARRKSGLVRFFRATLENSTVPESRTLWLMLELSDPYKPPEETPWDADAQSDFSLGDMLKVAALSERGVDC
ncbi:hypothetical protein BC628DRAFT_419976 [Trametes gibbosa]|nr:hypothetical protein BC628DRAFT_419976 [Trametes gibbosa]